VKLEASAPKVSFESRRAAITCPEYGEQAPISHPGIRRASLIPKLVEMRTPCQPQDAYLTLTSQGDSHLQSSQFTTDEEGRIASCKFVRGDLRMATAAKFHIVPLSNLARRLETEEPRDRFPFVVI
jgi:hypothetical protein